MLIYKAQARVLIFSMHNGTQSEDGRESSIRNQAEARGRDGDRADAQGQ
jgi:hypothetical protein